MAQRYLVLGHVVEASDSYDLQKSLAEAHRRKDKAFCLCRKGIELPLYIARRFEKFVVARWPGSGAGHATDCEHFDAPDDLTGLAQVRGAAVIDDSESGETALKVGFPLTRGPARSAPSALTNDKPVVKSTGQKLTMRGLLHYLWDRAELTHWHPLMEEKRKWGIVRRALLEAAAVCKVKQQGMSDVLFIPEVYRSDDAREWSARKRAALARVKASPDNMMILIGEVREIREVDHEVKVIIWYNGEESFDMDADMSRRFLKRFADEISLWRRKQNDGHLVMAASFCRRKTGLLDLVEVTVMPVTDRWLPFESVQEEQLLKEAVARRRRFVKGMRVNLEKDVPIASIVLKDTGERATAVYLHDPEERVEDSLANRMAFGGLDHAIWVKGEDLPKPHRRAYYRREAGREAEVGAPA
jgi:hypothetical protein